MGAILAAPAEALSGQPGPGTAHPGRGPAEMAPSHDSAQEVIGEMAWLLRDARGGMLMASGLLIAVTAGIGAEAAFSPAIARTGLAGLAGAVMLAALLGCWLRAAALLLLAGRPVLDQLSAHRWRTGAPVDPRVRWLTVPEPGPGTIAWDWPSVNLLLGAVRIRCERIHLADTWTFITVAVFGVWTALIFLA